MSDSRLVIDERAWGQFRRALALGILNGVQAVEAEAKAITPVHGDPSQGGEFATFAPGARPIGGTLRRSIHSVVYLDGRRIAGAEADENKRPIPSYVTGKGIEGFVGTNIEYAAFVHDGTAGKDGAVRMPARPFLATARLKVAPMFRDLVEAGYRRAMSTFGR